MAKIFLLFVALQFTAVACSQRKQEKSDPPLTAEVNEYPDITLRLRDGKELRAKDLRGKNIFVLFQPDCDHCQEEAVNIEQRIEEFKGYTLYFISSAPMDHITAFATNFKLHNKENVHFAWTTTEGVLNHYGAIATPSIYIYSDGRLRQSFNGQTDIENILNAL